MPAYNGYPFPDPLHQLEYLPNVENHKRIDGKNYMPVRFYIFNFGKIDDPEKYVKMRRRFNPLLYPLMWYVHDHQVAIVNKIDLDAYRSYNGLPKLRKLIFRSTPYDQLYPYVSPYRELNPRWYPTKEESLEHALKMLTPDDDKSTEIVSNDLEYWLTDITWYSKKESEEVCAICLKDFKLREPLTELHCGHYYHGSCIKEWLTWKNQCPLCRKPGYVPRKWLSYKEALVGNTLNSCNYHWWTITAMIGCLRSSRLVID